MAIVVVVVVVIDHAQIEVLHRVNVVVDPDPPIVMDLLGLVFEQHSIFHEESDLVSVIGARGYLLDQVRGAFREVAQILIYRHLTNASLAVRALSIILRLLLKRRMAMAHV